MLSFPALSPRVHVDDGEDVSHHDPDQALLNQGLLDGSPSHVPVGDGTRSPGGRPFHNDANSGSGRESDARNGPSVGNGSGSGKESDVRAMLNRNVPYTAPNSSSKGLLNEDEIDGLVNHIANAAGDVPTSTLIKPSVTLRQTSDGTIAEEAPMLLLVQQALYEAAGGGSEGADSEGLGDSPDVFGFNLPNHRPRVTMHAHSVSRCTVVMSLVLIFTYNDTFFSFPSFFSSFLTSSRDRCLRYPTRHRGQGASQMPLIPDTHLRFTIVCYLNWHNNNH